MFTCMDANRNAICVAYQLYATAAMYVYRITRNHLWATSEARLAQKLAAGSNEERVAYLQDNSGTTMMGKLTRIYVGSYGEGQKELQSMLSQKPHNLIQEKGDAEIQDSDNLTSGEVTPNSSDRDD